jgi:hypothetical protein
MKCAQQTVKPVKWSSLNWDYRSVLKCKFIISHETLRNCSTEITKQWRKCVGRQQFLTRLKLPVTFCMLELMTCYLKNSPYGCSYCPWCIGAWKTLSFGRLLLHAIRTILIIIDNITIRRFIHLLQSQQQCEFSTVCAQIGLNHSINTRNIFPSLSIVYPWWRNVYPLIQNTNKQQNNTPNEINNKPF